MATTPDTQQHPSAFPFRPPSDPNLALTYDPHAGRHAGPYGAHSAHQQGMTSGWVSTGFGLFQMLAPRTFLRMVGMPYPPWLIRAVGARDLLLGLGLLSQPESSTWRRARFVNDVMDTSLIGAALLGRRTRRGRLALFAAVAAGVIALDARTARAGSE